MEQFIGCDGHKKFSLFIAMNEEGEYGRAIRVGHERERMREFLAALPPGSQIALDSVSTILKEFWPDIRRKTHKNSWAQNSASTSSSSQAKQ